MLLNDVGTPTKQFFIEQALAYHRDMKAVADNASDGQVIHLAETFAMTQGRELVRKSFAFIVQERNMIHLLEKLDVLVGKVNL